MSDVTSKQINEWNQKFEKASAQDVLSWAIETFPSGASLSSSFGAQSAVLLHMATKIKPDLPIIFIDTGFLFKETHQFVEALTKKLNLNLKTYRASEAEIKDIAARLDRNDPKCCDDTKVDLMKKALTDVSCWITGLRRNQSASRKDIKTIELNRPGLIKVHPIASWSSKDVYDYLVQNDLPSHPLWEKGYTSIGCEPCTRKPTDSLDDRSGRWAGREKTECGIHTFLQDNNS